MRFFLPARCTAETSAHGVNEMQKTFFILGSISAGLSVAAGDFGAHALKSILTPERLVTYEKAVRYQMYHALGLLALAWALTNWQYSASYLHAAGWAFVAGSILFSGSLYALVLSDIRLLAMLTPVGGVSFALGWLLLALGVWRS